jgi:serine/threonine protein kinase
MFAFWPLNVGGYIANWLLSAAIDAGIATARSQTFNESTIPIIASIMLSLLLCRGFAPLILRLAAFYQLTLQKFSQSRTDRNLISSFADALSTPRTKLKLSPQHPHWRSFKESIQYIVVCYSILFCLVAFCPGPLGKSITGWLDSSIKDADPVIFSLAKLKNPSMLYCPAMTVPFSINWTDETHGTYTNYAPIVDKPVSKTHIIDEHGTRTIVHKPELPRQNANLQPLTETYNQINNEHTLQIANLIGKVLLGISPWNFSLDYHSDPIAFLTSLIAACDYSPQNPGLPPTVFHYQRPMSAQAYPHIYPKVSEDCLLIDKTGQPHWCPQYYAAAQRILHDVEADPSVKNVYVLGEPGRMVQYDPNNPARWNTPLLVGKTLSYFPHWHFHLSQYFTLRLFLASIVAAFGVVPFAVMSCAFLPLRRADEMLVSAQGILMPNRLIGSALLLWQDLQSVSLLNTKKVKRSQNILQLVFRTGSRIKLRLDTLSEEHLSELLAIADEQAADCRFDEAVIQLRTELAQDNSSSSLADAKKFTSTIFQPYNTGEWIHDYSIRIVRKLASKSLSAVYLARGLDCKLVVIKQLVLPNPNDSSSEKYRQSLQREYSILRKLEHPMLASVIDSFEDGRSNNLVLEHIAGEDLRSYVNRRGARQEKIVIAWAREICQFMQYLHNQEPPILHRDLTPDNIMLDDKGQIRIVDFGAAHQFMEGVTGTLIGKQCYIAPEQLRGKANIQSDIYSFGCTLYFLLTGKDPKALSQSDLSHNDRKISPALQKLVQTCTEFDYAQRPASFADILLALPEEAPRTHYRRGTLHAPAMPAGSPRSQGDPLRQSNGQIKDATPTNPAFKLNSDDRKGTLHAPAGSETYTTGRGAPYAPTAETISLLTDESEKLSPQVNKLEPNISTAINIPQKLKEQCLYE